MSIIYEGFWYLRNKIVFYLRSAPKKHRERVAYVQEQVRRWNANGRKSFMCTARPGWLTMSLYVGKYKKSFTNIEVNLCDVVDIDQERRIVRVEPLATMGQVSAALLPLGWTLPVVPELDDLTVGGLICGVGIESTSHVHGLFAETCESFEVVLADGSCVRASRTENAELFYSLPWSHGTLGFLVAAEIRIVPIKPYVRLEYFPCHTKEEGVRLFNDMSRSGAEGGNTFVEALAYNRDQMVVMRGQFADKDDKLPVNNINRFWKPWFYKHVESFLKKKSTPAAEGPAGVELIPLREYYHRHTRSIFWELEEIVPFGNHPLFRYTLGWAMPPKISLLKLTTTGAIKELYEKNHVVQDMLVPLNNLSEALDVFDREFLVYPLWLCPFRFFPPEDARIRPFVQGLPDDQMYVDIGAYGIPKVPKFEARESLRRVEEYVRSVRGYQMLYAVSYMTREEFREMFDHSLYDSVREKLGCKDAFPEIYDKVSKAARS